jgi:hypothetical protein
MNQKTTVLVLGLALALVATLALAPVLNGASQTAYATYVKKVTINKNNGHNTNTQTTINKNNGHNTNTQ